MNDLRQHFKERIGRFGRVRRGLANAALAYRSGVVMLGIVVVLLLFAGVPLNAPLLDAAVLAVAAGLLLTLVCRALWRRQRFKSDLSEAFRMEELAGGLNSRLISALDFLDRRHESPLTAAVIDAAGRDLDEVPFEAKLGRGAHGRARRRFLGVLAVMLILGMTPWFGFGRLAARAGAAWFEVCERLFPTEWELVPGPGRHVHLLGETVEVVLRFTRNGFDEVTVIQDDPDTPETGKVRAVLSVAEDGTASTVLHGDAQRVRRVVFEFGRRATRTEPVEIVFTTRPVIENMQIEIIPPIYTRQPPRDLVGIQTRIAGLPGTRVSLGLTFSKILTSAMVRFEGDDQEVALDVVGRFAGLQFVIAESRRARIQIEDVHGFGLLQPHILDIDLLADEPPRLAAPGFLKPEMPFKAGAARGLGFGVRAWDDYGVARTVLKWERSTLENRNTITAKGEVERLNVPPLPIVVAEFLNAFSEQELVPGDVISFHIEVADNREPEAQTVSSPRFWLFVHQDDLGGGMLGMDGDLMFASWASRAARERLKRHRESTEVPPPQDIRGVSKWVSDFDADVTSDSRPPTVRGDFGASVERYFRVLSTAVFKEEDEK